MRRISPDGLSACRKWARIGIAKVWVCQHSYVCDTTSACQLLGCGTLEIITAVRQLTLDAPGLLLIQAGCSYRKCWIS